MQRLHHQIHFWVICISKDLASKINAYKSIVPTVKSFFHFGWLHNNDEEHGFLTRTAASPQACIC